MHGLIILIFLISSAEEITALIPDPTIECMTHQEAIITNDRYKNEYVIWGRPKGLLYGNIVGAGPEQKANLYPDKSATYFDFNIHWEGNLTLRGRFPNARYFSITVANQLGNGQLGDGNFLRGDQIIPDPGSSNPFLSSNLRNVTNRNYTVQIIKGEPPSNPPVNTIFTGPLSNKNRAHISIRTYLVDKGYDGTGNVPLYEVGNGLPTVSLDLPGGNRITGPELLKILNAEKLGDPNGYETAEWLSNIDKSKDKINAPCFPLPTSQVFWNTDYSVTGAFEADHPEKRVRDYPPDDSGGFANNPDTKYMVILFSFSYGEILVVRGTIPTHPNTRKGEVKLPKDPQVQYFSVSTAAAPSYGAGWHTICDEEFYVDDDGNYTIVVSWPWNRPNNAIPENNVNWISPGDGEGHYIGARIWVGTLYFRYQNPSDNWKESPANIPMPSLENPIPQDPIIMGKYYPRGEYMSKKDFEEREIITSAA